MSDALEFNSVTDVADWLESLHITAPGTNSVTPDKHPVAQQAAAIIRAKLEQAEASTAEPVAWRKVADSNLPPLGTKVIVCIDGVVQDEQFELDCADCDPYTGGSGGYFWSHPDCDPCPEVKETDLWMPWPTLYAAPPSTADGWVLMPSKYGYSISGPHGQFTEIQSPRDDGLPNDTDPVLYAFLSALVAQPSTAEALDWILEYIGVDGSHHKQWLLDQVVQILAGDRYEQLVSEWCDGEDGPDTYEWDHGVAP